MEEGTDTKEGWVEDLWMQEVDSWDPDVPFNRMNMAESWQDLGEVQIDWDVAL